MDVKEKRKKKVVKVRSEEIESVLMDAEIVARWSEKPFYVS